MHWKGADLGVALLWACEDAQETSERCSQCLPRHGEGQPPGVFKSYYYYAAEAVNQQNLTVARGLLLRATFRHEGECLAPSVPKDKKKKKNHVNNVSAVSAACCADCAGVGLDATVHKGAAQVRIVHSRLLTSTEVTNY